MRKLIFSAILLSILTFANFSNADKPHERTAPPREHIIKVLEKFNPHDDMLISRTNHTAKAEKDNHVQANKTLDKTGKFIPQEAGDARQISKSNKTENATKSGNSNKSMIMQKAHAIQARGSCAEEAAACSSGKASSGITTTSPKVEKQNSMMRDAIEKKENEKIIAALKAMLAKKMHLGEK